MKIEKVWLLTVYDAEEHKCFKSCYVLKEDAQKYMYDDIFDCFLKGKITDLSYLTPNATHFCNSHYTWDIEEIRLVKSI